MTGSSRRSPPIFDAGFKASLRDLVHWRRDVRRFRRDPVDDTLLVELIDLAARSPSVGHSQPWRFVVVQDQRRREAVTASFERANATALAGYADEQRQRYAGLKLAGLRDAPVHLAVFADEETKVGSGLGRQTMPETLRYSVVGAIQTLWLAARAEGLGVGWISILEPAVVTAALDVPSAWTLVAYLCIGWPSEDHSDPELERYGWETRIATSMLYR